MRGAPGDLGGVAGKSPGAQAWMKRGRSTPAGRAEQLVSAGVILAVPKAGVFQTGHSLSNSHADGRPMQRQVLLGMAESAATISRAMEHGWVILQDVRGKPLKRREALTDEGRRLTRKGR
jgi:hypothetical protein